MDGVVNLKKLALLILVLMPIGVCYGQPIADMEKFGETFEALSVASRNGGDVTGLLLIFNRLVSMIDEEKYDPVNVETQLNAIIEQANRINDMALTEKRNEMIKISATLLAVIVVEYYLWRGFPRLYWDQWLKRRGSWTVK